jgi:glycosyltransferase involved in cell wall biosynthesis
MSSSMPPQLSVVLPCYNEARGIATILKRFAEAGDGHDFELILVDNGSHDDTQQVLGELLPCYRFARSVRVEVNRGYGHGIWTGLRAARGEVLAWSHADLQTDPADVFRALKEYRQAMRPTKTLIKGQRSGRRLNESIVSLGMGVLATAIFRKRLSEINAQPKVFHRSLLDQLNHPPIDFNFDVYVLVEAKRHGWQIKSISVRFPPRQYGHSNWARTWRSKLRTIWRSMKYMTALGAGGPQIAAAQLAIDQTGGSKMKLTTGAKQSAGQSRNSEGGRRKAA